MGKISDELREEAAAYCSLMACFLLPMYCIGELPCELFNADVVELADKASSFALSKVKEVSQFRGGYLEAEALLRTGWEP